MNFERDYHNHTTLHPIALLSVLVLGAMLVMVDRRKAILPVLIMTCFIPSAQRIVVAGLDFDFVRIMVLFGTLRILLRNEYRAFYWIGLDTLIVLWAIVNATFPMIRFGVAPLIVNRLGLTFDVLGMYFLFRILIKSWDDVRTAVYWLMCLSLPVAAFFTLELATGRNIFSIFGGVSAFTEVRDGRLRCQGAFAHPILAGAFWAAMLPLAACQLWQPKSGKWLVLASICASLAIVVASASSTPLFGVITAIIGYAMFFARHHLQLVRWSLLCMIIGLHLIMQAPVWHLIARVSAVGGGSGWHRFALMDGFITHWYEWWMVGSYVGSRHWGHFTFDVTNFYIVQGLRGGVIALGLWIGIIALAFAYVGRLRVAYEESRGPERIFAWGIGVSLLVHAVNLFGVSYFGQIWVSWYLLLGIIGSLYASHCLLVLESSAVTNSVGLFRVGLKGVPPQRFPFSR